jgi:hypothetical protein
MTMIHPYHFDRFDPADLFVTTVSREGQGSVFHDQEVVHSNVQLPMSGISRNAVVEAYEDGEPCIVVAGHSHVTGIFIRHAITLNEVRSLPYKEAVYCVCISATGTKVFFGARSG